MPSDQVEVVHTRVFAIGPNGGNPCPVVLSADQLLDGDMLALAQKFGLDTVFILKPRLKQADIRLRYFVPDHEMGVSGHATIAAVTVGVLEQILRSARVRVATLTGVFEAKIQWSEGILVTLDQNKPIFGPAISPDLVLRALNIGPELLDLARGPIQSVSVSRAKLVVPVRDSIALNCLTPNFDALWELCDELKVTGLYPFTRETSRENACAEARQFPLRAGFPEDAATGVAAAALGAYLARYDRQSKRGRYNFPIAQGYAMGAPSLIEAIADCQNGEVERTAIRGLAKVIAREHVSISGSRR